MRRILTCVGGGPALMAAQGMLVRHAVASLCVHNHANTAATLACAYVRTHPSLLTPDGKGLVLERFVRVLCGGGGREREREREAEATEVGACFGAAPGVAEFLANGMPRLALDALAAITKAV